MAFIPAVLDTTLATSSANSNTSASITPGANALVYAACAVRASSGITFSSIAISDTSGDVGAWEVFSFPHPTTASNSILIIGGVALAGASPGTFTVTVSWNQSSATSTRRVLSVGHIPDGFDAADMVTQFKTGSSVVSTLAITLDAAPDAASCILAMVAALNATAIDPGTGFTELSDNETAAAAPNIALETMYDVTPADASADWASLGSLSAGIVLEINPAAAGETFTFNTQPANTQENTVMANIVVTSSDVTATDIVTLTLGDNPGAGTLGGDTTKAMIAGVATFNDIEINNPGVGYSLRANAAGHDEKESASFNITAEPATKLAFFVQPSEVNLDAIILPAIVVRALNSENVLDPTFQGDVTIALNDNPGGATLTGTTTVTAINGVATFDDLSLDQAGDGYTLIASEA